MRMKLLDDVVRAFWDDTREMEIGLEFLAWDQIEFGVRKPDLEIYQEECEVGTVTMGFRKAVEVPWMHLAAVCLAQKIQGQRANLQVATGVHEIRNSLSVLAGYIEIMETQSADPSLSKMESLVLQIANGLEDLLIGYARAYPAEVFDITQLCQEVAAEYQLVHKARQIQWKLNTEPVLLEANRRQMRQILRNLLQNAVDAVSDHGHIAVETEVRENNVVILVSDDGAGVHDAIRPYLFEPYYTSKAKGHGLGLSVCKRLADIHKGSIGVENLAPGSRFTVVLAQRTS
jgi:signal transduction histidine kinase